MPVLKSQPFASKSSALLRKATIANNTYKLVNVQILTALFRFIGSLRDIQK